MLKFLRCLRRCAGMVIVIVGLPADWFFSVVVLGRGRKVAAQARLLHRWAGFTVGLMGCEVEVRGKPPGGGLCVSNHLGYLDILVLGSLAPMLFVSKHDVLFWPLFGQLAWMCGTLFIRRERKGHVADVGEQMERVLRSGVPLILFPEGTSSGGDTVLPFKSSLFEPAVEHQWTVTPLHVGYALDDGSVADEVAYWRDMTLVPHLLNLFTKRNLRAMVVFGEPLAAGEKRKDLCRRAHEAVVELGP